MTVRGHQPGRRRARISTPEPTTGINRHSEPPLELGRYRATEREVATMSPEWRKSRTCDTCGSVYRVQEFIRECAGFHRPGGAPNRGPAAESA